MKRASLRAAESIKYIFIRTRSSKTRTRTTNYYSFRLECRINDIYVDIMDGKRIETKGLILKN